MPLGLEESPSDRCHSPENWKKDLLLLLLGCLDRLQLPSEAYCCAVALPQIQLVGLSETRGKAIRERVRAALLNSGFTVPDRRITINLSPADLPTDHPGYDLPIALALLAASNQLPDSIDQTVSQPICAL